MLSILLPASQEPTSVMRVGLPLKTRLRLAIAPSTAALTLRNLFVWLHGWMDGDVPVIYGF